MKKMEKDKFQPIVMPCTKEQYKSLIPVLKQHNIKYDRYRATFNGIVNNFNNNINSIGKTTNVDDIYFHKVTMKRKIYQRFNRKIFLKSLGIIEEPEFVLPEKWCVKITENNINVLKSYYLEQNYKYVGFSGWMLSDCGYDGTGMNWYHGNDHTGGNNNLLKYKEITFEQFQKYVLEQNTSLLESQSVTNKQTKTMVKATVEESQPKEKIHKGCLIKWKDIVGIVTSTNNEIINILSLSKGIGVIYTIDMEVDKVLLFKGKLTLEQ